MPNVSRETASEKIALEGLDVRLEHLDGGYSVCFESHSADADLADLFRGLPEDRAQADLKAAVDYLTGRGDVRADAVGIIGWDVGGGFALDAARHDPRLKAVVVCYGRLTTDPALLEPLHASVLGIFAGKDEGIPPETREQFRAAMEKAGKRLAGLHVYPDRRHGFMDPSSAARPDAADALATADAWKKIEAYLAAELPR
jgi:carboxymethylenebutenolidase